MTAKIGIRKEEKNEWERRAPLAPDHVAELVREHDLRIAVQPSPRRVFSDDEYAASGATLTDDLSDCGVILGVKEIPTDDLERGKTYVYFSHTIKGQPYNMPMLGRLLDLGATLIDYERIADARGRRLIFFGRHAGYAGMIDTLWALGQRLLWEGMETPFSEIRLAHQYGSLDEANAHVTGVGDMIRRRGLDPSLRPLTFAFTGSGNVSQGAQEVFGRLPFQEVSPEELPALRAKGERGAAIVKTVLEKQHRYARENGGRFDEGEFRANPERYRGTVGSLLPHITVLVNGIYWDPATPKLVTRADLRALFAREAKPRLLVLGDITCDIDGSIEATLRSTTPGDPVFVYEPDSGAALPGVAGKGPVVMAVDNLPCELPLESSEHFGDSLERFVPALARCRWDVPFRELALPDELRRAVVVHRGELAPAYEYLRPFVEAAAV